MLTGLGGLPDEAPSCVEASGGELPGGDAIMASKKAALLLTELGLDLRLSCWEAGAEPLVLQLLLDCWRSAVLNNAEAAQTAL